MHVLDDSSDGKSHPSRHVAGRDAATMSMEELDALPLPPELVGRSRGDFAAMVQKIAREVIASLPEGELPSPQVRSALNAGQKLNRQKPKAGRGTLCGDQIAVNTTLAFPRLLQ